MWLILLLEIASDIQSIVIEEVHLGFNGQFRCILQRDDLVQW